MQNRYVGDVGDFAKYSLLRALLGQSRLRLGIVWYLFADESHNMDGLHTSYLQRSEFRKLDPELHDRLSRIVRSGRRSVRSIFQAEIFPPDTLFFDLPIAPPSHVRAARETHEACRTKWLSSALAATAGCDLVFLDPDNGLETRSIRKHAPRAGKYVFWDELESFWDRGQSLVVYHHLNRSASVEEQTKVLRKTFRAQFAAAEEIICLLFRRGSCRHFWIVGQTAHASTLRKRINAMIDSGWGGYLEIA
jgi:hypothetical protein